MHFLLRMSLAKKVQCRLRRLMLREKRVPCRMWMTTLLIRKRKMLAQQQTIMSFLEPFHKNLDSLLPLSWWRVHCKMRMMIEKQLKTGRETERFHKNLRLQRTRKRWRLRKIQTRRRRKKETRIQTRKKTGDRYILTLLKGSGSRQVCLKTRRTVGRQCRWMRLIVESQKKLLENWRKMRWSRMKMKIHQRRNLRERRMKERPGLEKWKRYSELHYMMV